MITSAQAQSFGGPAGTGAMPMTYVDWWPVWAVVAAVVLFAAASRRHR